MKKKYNIPVLFLWWIFLFVAFFIFIIFFLYLLPSFEYLKKESLKIGTLLANHTFEEASNFKNVFPPPGAILFIYNQQFRILETRENLETKIPPSIIFASVVKKILSQGEELWGEEIGINFDSQRFEFLAFSKSLSSDTQGLFLISKEVLFPSLAPFLRGVFFLGISVLALFLVLGFFLLLIQKYQNYLEEVNKILEIRVRARTRELEEINKNLESMVKARTEELEKKLKELERFQKVAVGRELKMIELKKKIKELEKKLYGY